MSSSPAAEDRSRVVFSFGPHRFDGANGILSRDDEEIPLAPLSVRVLQHLLAHAGKVVSKEELLAACWDEPYVSDDALVHVISELRKALADSPGRPRYIQTLPRRGYRFVGAVEITGASAGTRGLHGGPASGEASSHRRSWIRPLVVTTTVVVVLSLAVVSLRRIGQDGAFVTSTGATSSIESLAVLPFDNLMNDPEQEYFVQGIHDALITELANNGSLRVISRTSMMRYRESDKSIPQIARELDVDAVVEGTVLRDSGRVRITAQLIDATSDSNVWAASYERELENVVALVGEVATAIGGEIAAELASEVRTPRPVDPAAHDAFLRGRYATNRFTGEGLSRALVHFEEATRIDPEFARAWASLAGAHLLLGGLGYESSGEHASQARRAALRALELDDRLSEAHSVLGCVTMYFDWDWEAAAESFRRALQLNPGDPIARHGYGDYLLAMGRPEESLEQVELGRRADPYSLVAVIPAIGHRIFVRRYEEVETEVRKAMQEFTVPDQVRDWRALALWQLGRHEEAIAE
ncbi:MAG: winged helix-turn-helix domain-containing protein, partial [Acidobacteriota bacterium]